MNPGIARLSVVPCGNPRRAASSAVGVGLTFNDFLVNMAPIVAIELAVFIVAPPGLFRGSFEVDPARGADVMALNEREVIRNPGLLGEYGAVPLVVFAGFVGRSVFLSRRKTAVIHPGPCAVDRRLSGAYCEGAAE